MATVFHIVYYTTLLRDTMNHMPDSYTTHVYVEIYKCT